MRAKWCKIVWIVCIVGINIFLCGCRAQREPQNRHYIMCMGIDAVEKGWRVTYSFPDLAALTGTDAQAAEPVRSVEAATIAEASIQLNATSDKIADYSQMSVILVGDSVRLSGEKMSRLIQELTAQKAVKRTVMIGYAVGNAEDIVRLDEKVDGSIGVFLYELCQNNYENRGFDLSVLEDFAGGREKKKCFTPVFGEQEKQPVLIRLEPGQ